MVRFLMVVMGNDFFDVSPESKPLKRKEKVRFHSTTAQIHYLSNRIWCRVKVACQYVCKRVCDPPEKDKKKLMKLLKYL